jgi:hypothetical protein
VDVCGSFSKIHIALCYDSIINSMLEDYRPLQLAEENRLAILMSCLLGSRNPRIITLIAKARIRNYIIRCSNRVFMPSLDDN